MNDKQLFTLLSNNQKRTVYIMDDANWTTVSGDRKIKVQRLNMTPFHRVMIHTHHYYLGNQWKMISDHYYMKYPSQEDFELGINSMNDIIIWLQTRRAEAQQTFRGVQ